MDQACYISIVVPCYNAGKFIEQTIGSVLQQPFKNWELILVNDGSKDDTADICSKFSEADDRIHCINVENGGAGHARNIGVKAAKGTWIIFLDADDLLLANSINAQLCEKLREWEMRKIDVIYTSVVRGTDMNLREPVRFFRPEPCEHIQYRPNMAFWNGIYRKSFLMDTNTAFFEYREQDIETAFRYIVFANAKNKIADSKIAFYLQRENPQSNTHTWSRIKLHYIKTLVYNELLETYSHAPNRDFLFEEVVNELHEFYRWCLKSDRPDSDRIKTLNKIFVKTIVCPGGKCVTKAGKRHLVSNIAFYVAANLMRRSKHSSSPSARTEELKLDNTPEIMERLTAVSGYIQKCLLED